MHPAQYPLGLQPALMMNYDDQYLFGAPRLQAMRPAPYVVSRARTSTLTSGQPTQHQPTHAASTTVPSHLRAHPMPQRQHDCNRMDDSHPTSSSSRPQQMEVEVKSDSSLEREVEELILGSDLVPQDMDYSHPTLSDPPTVPSNPSTA